MPNKKNINSVEDLSEKLSKAQSIYFTNYLGLNVSDVTNLRKKFYENGVEYLVVKNTLLKIASSKNKIKLDEELFSGSTAIALSYDEPVKAAKIIKEFLKDHELPTVKGVFFDGSYLDSSQFDKIANLPSKDESLTKLAIMLKNPVQNFSNLLSAPMQNLLNTLKGIEKSKNLQN